MDDEHENKFDMPSGIRKSRRSKKKASESVISNNTASGSNSNQYLDDREKNAIENWNETVPKKSTRSETIPEEQDPIIQAYLEAKLNLFRAATMSRSQDPRNRDARSVSSTQS